MTAAAPVLPLENSYAKLPEAFFARVAPTPVAAPKLLRLNRPLAEQLGLDPEALARPESVEILAGNRVAAGSEPLAMAYAGHQFGHFSPSLGDGRAILLGEVVGRDGLRRDIHLKGSGPTPFSRRGDGRAALGPVLREYVLSEAMAGLGIPTTRSLAMLATGEPVYRERAMPGAVLVRVALSHVRVGTFEYFARRGERDAVRDLADYVIHRLDPACAEAEHPYRALLAGVIRRQAELIADWMLVGFIHGVMNTDNVSIAGETIDFGPCAFLDAYEPGKVYSSIDHGGRYAYDQQPRIGQWNCIRFAEALLSLLGDSEEAAVAVAEEELSVYPGLYEARYRAGLRRKIGLLETRDGDDGLIGDFLVELAEQKADFTLSFRGLAEGLGRDAQESESPWFQRWRERLAAEGRSSGELRTALRAANPAYIPRNHRVQEAIEAAENDDLQPLDDLLAVVSRPYAEHPERAAYQRPPEPHEVVQQTFCGT